MPAMHLSYLRQEDALPIRPRQEGSPPTRPRREGAPPHTPNGRAPHHTPQTPRGRAPPPPHAPDPQREGAPTTRPRQMLYLLSRGRQKKCLHPSHSLKVQPVETVTASEKEAFFTSDPQLLQ